MLRLFWALAVLFLFSVAEEFFFVNRYSWEIRKTGKISKWHNFYETNQLLNLYSQRGEKSGEIEFDIFADMTDDLNRICRLAGLNYN
ncbi:hypothetical protein [Mesorhizobium sp. M0435]|uniref:hypothetical protein n=1 Tax=unclassified Mesorhizobium TaxID=325217 RepID=UPI003336A186